MHVEVKIPVSRKILIAVNFISPYEESEQGNTFG